MVNLEVLANLVDPESAVGVATFGLSTRGERYDAWGACCQCVHRDEIPRNRGLGSQIASGFVVTAPFGCAASTCQTDRQIMN